MRWWTRLLLSLVSVILIGLPAVSVSPGAHVAVASPATPAQFYGGCVAKGSLSTIDHIGTATTAALCEGGTAVVIRAGSALNFCLNADQSPTDFTVNEVPTCKKESGNGGFATGTDLYACVDKNGSLTDVGAAQPECKKYSQLVGLSFPQILTLTVSTDGDGSGSVTSDIGGINCPGTCTASLIENTQITVTANAEDGSSFTGWSDPACTGTTCATVLTQNTAVTATFANACATQTIDLPPTLPPGEHVMVTEGDKDPRPLMAIDAFDLHVFPYKVDASAFMDLACPPAAVDDRLSFRWRFLSSDFPGGVTTPGVDGMYTAVLELGMNSLPATSTGGDYTLVLEVISPRNPDRPADHRQTTMIFTITVGSDLTLEVFTRCQYETDITEDSECYFMSG